MEDAQNGQSVAGAVFQIIAAEDIVTMDGTLRFHEGETAGEINCNEQGYGESEPLYLGTYLLRQSGIPEYYAKIQEEPEAEVEKRGNEETETLEVLAERTRIRLKLTDELYDTLPLEGAQFSVSQEGEDELELLYTDRNGILELSSLDKNAVYHIRQTEAGEGYLLPGEEYTVTVDQDGRIDGEAEAELNLTNRIIRVNIQAAEAVLQRGLTDVPMALYDADGTLIHSWRANGTGESVTGLNPGTYRITLGEAGDKSYEFQVRDVCEIQNWRISVFTWQSGAVLAAAAGCVAAVVVAVVAKSRKKRSEKSDE